MAPFSVPAPHIRPHRPIVIGGPKSIDTNTKIEMWCDTFLKYEVFYTLDGTRPQPYVGIVQGSKTHKYFDLVRLPLGKITVRAVAVNAKVRSMHSSVVTKCFDVVKGEPRPQSGKPKKVRRKKSADDGHGRSECVDLAETSQGDPKDVNIQEDLVDSPSEDGSTVLLAQNKSNDIVEFPLLLKAIDANLELSPDPSSNNSKAGSVAGTGEEDETLSEDHNLSPTRSQGSVGSRHSVTDEENRIPDGATDHWRKVKESLSHSTPHPACMRCDLSRQHCLLCRRPNVLSHRFCIECGSRLVRTCRGCSEANSAIATFCQFCGIKMEEGKDCGEEIENETPHLQTAVIPAVQRNEASSQKSLSTSNKTTQTLPVRRAKTSSSKSPPHFSRRLPSHTPGRGFWHQQLDYICNHLKSFAYNNIDFRESISEPALSDFQSAKVTQSEENVTVTIQFSPFVMGNDSGKKKL